MIRGHETIRGREAIRRAPATGVWVVVLMTLATPVFAQTQRPEGGSDSEDATPVAAATQRTGEIDVDGRLDAAAWALAPVATGFVQREPIEGEPAQEATEVRIVFDGSAVFVGARMYDRNPNGIASQLVRRDGQGQFDYFEVLFDPNRDRRTAYRFRVSAANVQRDVYLFDDGEDDEAWDAVWTSAVHTDSLGWSAEMRIPLSQMRYEASSDTQTWGVNFTRRRLQSNETTDFSLISRTQRGVVSQSAALEGMVIPRASRLFELRPYALASAFVAPSEPGDPFFDGWDMDSRAGLDLRYGLGAQFTLNATVNPDFGQVESDPAVINLTAFETRFDERRPFFVEQAQVFDFSLSAGQDLYYSRRIGRRPQGRAPSGATYVDVPQAATILGAAKLTGRTTSGLSLGALAALTREERGRAVTSDVDEPQPFIMEPETYHGVVRAQQDFNEGMSTIGGIATGLVRSLPSDGSFDELTRTALSGGGDFEHQWGDRTWAIYGYASAAHVRGDSTAMIRIQSSANHRRQRPDARWVDFDSTATSLTAMDWRFTLAKQEGRHWTGAVWLAQTLPGFEINDFGFSRRQEALDGGARIRYQEIQPGSLFRSYHASFSTFHNASHDALADVWSLRSWQRAHVSGSLNLDARLELLNYWEIEAEASVRPWLRDRTSTRGGPLMLSPLSNEMSLQLQTDRRTWINFGPEVQYAWKQADGGRSVQIGLETELRPSSNIEIEIEPQFTWSRNAAQYVRTTDVVPYEPTYGSRYLFGEIEQRELSMELRLDYIFSPTLSLQLFAQPLIASGDYRSYRQLVAPETFDFDVFEEGTHAQADGVNICIDGRTCVDPEGTRYVDFEGNGQVDYSFTDQDFNVRSLVGNLVFRWEYRPGSTLFLVWQRRHFNEIPDGQFTFGRDLSALLSAPAENAFMVKVSYWLAIR
jgi:hypothetical protein